MTVFSEYEGDFAGGRGDGGGEVVGVDFEAEFGGEGEEGGGGGGGGGGGRLRAWHWCGVLC